MHPAEEQRRSCQMEVSHALKHIVQMNDSLHTPFQRLHEKGEDIEQSLKRNIERLTVLEQKLELANPASFDSDPGLKRINAYLQALQSVSNWCPASETEQLELRIALRHIVEGIWQFLGKHGIAHTELGRSCNLSLHKIWYKLLLGADPDTKRLQDKCSRPVVGR